MQALFKLARKSLATTVERVVNLLNYEDFLSAKCYKAIFKISFLQVNKKSRISGNSEKLVAHCCCCETYSLRLERRHLRNHMMMTWWARETVYWLNLKGLVQGRLMAITDMYWSLLKLANTLGKLNNLIHKYKTTVLSNVLDRYKFSRGSWRIKKF